MGSDANDLDRALDVLRAELGADTVLDEASTTRTIAQRTLNPGGDLPSICLLRPRNTEECRLLFERLRAVGCDPKPIAALTTFWEPRSNGSPIAVDTLELRAPCGIDPLERIGYFGAGVTVREVDRMARSEGLCLVAYPDGDGSQSVGSMAAVACGTGLGLGRIEPVDQIVGLTVVARDATVVKTGASWRLGHGGVANGMPDPTGIFVGSQGSNGVITEVVLKLWPAPFLASRTWDEPWLPAEGLADRLKRARLCLDQGTVDSLRLETVNAGTTQPEKIEWLARCWAPGSADAADRHSAAVAEHFAARSPRRWVESDAGRRGDLPDYDQRFSVPPGEHRARTGREGFTGIEAVVNWGAQLDAALPLFAALFEKLGPLGPGHRRLGIYPSTHAVSIGVQVMLSGGEATVDAVRQTLAEYVDPLDAVGAIPYRAGRLWQRSLERREATDPACAMIRRAGNPERPS